MDTEKILENLSDMGCNEKEISSMKKMYEEGDTDTLLRDLRKCRCHLMDELHDSQKKVDNMDFLIRQIQKEKKFRRDLWQNKYHPAKISWEQKR